MRVRYFAHIRKITGCAEEDFPYQESIGALARSLCERYGKALQKKIFLNGAEELSPEIIILINGRHVSHLGGLIALLEPEDRVDVFPVVAGG